jgi:phosphate uptake regulator, PhoU
MHLLVQMKRSPLKVIKKDKQADEEYEAVIRQSMTFMMQNTQAIPRFLNVIWAARALERIGDRATNISEYVIYFVIGKNVSHLEIKDQLDF